MTHRMINSSDINEALDRIGGFMKELAAGGCSKRQYPGS